MDIYRNFQELAQNEREGIDFAILNRDAGSPIAVLAPHGGDIEPGTLAIAEALAGNDFTFYAFSGIKKSGNGKLHLTSNRFDEPVGVMTAEKAAIVVTIHGNREESDTIFIGGGNNPLKKRLLEALTAAGFRTEISNVPGIRGINPENICNRGTRGVGVQLEIGRGLREKMFDDFYCRPMRKKTHVFYAFVATIREALLSAAI